MDKTLYGLLMGKIKSVSQDFRDLMARQEKQDMNIKSLESKIKQLEQSSSSSNNENLQITKIFSIKGGPASYPKYNNTFTYSSDESLKNMLNIHGTYDGIGTEVSIEAYYLKKLYNKKFMFKIYIYTIDTQSYMPEIFCNQTSMVMNMGESGTLLKKNGCKVYSGYFNVNDGQSEPITIFKIGELLQKTNITCVVELKSEV